MISIKGSITKPFVEGKKYTIGVVKELVMVKWFWIVLTDTKIQKEMIPLCCQKNINYFSILMEQISRKRCNDNETLTTSEAVEANIL